MNIVSIQKKYAVADVFVFRKKVLSWLQQFNTFCFLDTNGYTHARYNDLIVGAGVRRSFLSSDTDALAQWQDFLNEKKAWYFGHLGYESFSPFVEIVPREDLVGFGNIGFFEPEIVLQLTQNSLLIVAENPDAIWTAINEQDSTAPAPGQYTATVQRKVAREDYLEIIRKLQAHILRGDCYEINFCQEFFAQNCIIDPLDFFRQLNELSPNPFSALYKAGDRWLLCASPERFLKKEGNNIISQPIKGTLPRNAATGAGLQAEQDALYNSAKDRAENVMVVDMVRSDLSKICIPGSVEVTELFGIYSFAQVHQMITTISGTLKQDTTVAAVFEACFPMGSMTGAPKKRVMELVQQYEQSRRGIFSGTVGVISPNGDFDFNVVIRSVMYNAQNRYLSFQAGSGITGYSHPEKEWEECEWKTRAIRQLLGDVSPGI